MKKRIGVMTIFLMLISVSFVYAACTDTDGGINKDVYGSVSDEHVSFSDYCSGGKLVERYCSNQVSLKIKQIYNSPTGFTDDIIKFESDGTEYTATITSEGSASVVIQGETYSFPYFGNGSDARISYPGGPFYVGDTIALGVGGLASSKTIDCENGCTGGVCNKYSDANSYCKDSDGGIDYNVKGSTIVNSSVTEFKEITREDYCFYYADYGSGLTVMKVNEQQHGRLEEWYCDGKQFGSKEYVCPDWCKGGACITKTETNTTLPPQNQNCTDSDGGKNYYLKGQTIEGGDAISVDYCIDNKILRENYCSNQLQSDSENIVCDIACQDGACIAGGGPTCNGRCDEGDSVECPQDCPNSNTACKNDEDCPPINCLVAPCPQMKCVDSKCVSSTEKQECKVDSDCKNQLAIACESSDEECIAKYTVSCINDKCVNPYFCDNIGLRKSGKYCSSDNLWRTQLTTSVVCENNFECTSNVCIGGKCVSEGFIQKIMNWFKRLFVVEEKPNYVCPKVSSIDCMPGTIKANNEYCQKEYRAWTEKNCDVKFVD